MAMKLPPGFVLDEDKTAHVETKVGLPPGFVLDQPVQPEVQQSKQVQQGTNGSMPGMITQMAIDAVKGSPLGMATQGMGALNKGIETITKPIIPAEGLQKYVSPLFRGTRAVGVGTMLGKVQPPSAGASINILQRAKAAYQPDYQPANLAEKIGSTLGENAPVFGAMALPGAAVTVPILMAAQQVSETGKFSPVIASLPAVSLAGKIATPLSRMGARGVNAALEISPKTATRLRGNPAEEAISLGQKLAREGLPKSNPSATYTKVVDNLNKYGQDVGKAMDDIRNTGFPTVADVNVALKPIAEQIKVFESMATSQGRRLARPYKEIYANLLDQSKTNGGFVDVDSVMSRMREVGTLLSHTSENSESYKPLMKLYSVLANTRDGVVNAIADATSNPSLASNLKVANANYSQHARILPDIEKSAARYGVKQPSLFTGRGGIINKVSGKISKGLAKLSNPSDTIKGLTGVAAVRNLGSSMFANMPTRDEIYGQIDAINREIGPAKKFVRGTVKPGLTSNDKMIGAVLTKEKAREYIMKAKGGKSGPTTNADIALARKLAAKDGWRVR